MSDDFFIRESYRVAFVPSHSSPSSKAQKPALPLSEPLIEHSTGTSFGRILVRCRSWFVGSRPRDALQRIRSCTAPVFVENRSDLNVTEHACNMMAMLMALKPLVNDQARNMLFSMFCFTMRLLRCSYRWPSNYRTHRGKPAIRFPSHSIKK